MTVLMLAPGSRGLSEHDLANLSTHFRLRWPGTFVLGLMPKLLPGLEADEQFDWMSWPLVADEHSGASDLSLLKKIMERFGVQALVGLGADSRKLLDMIGGGFVLMGGNADFSALDDWLVPRLAVEVLALPQYDWGELLERLENHAAAGRAKRLRVRWLGRACPELLGLLGRLCKLDLFGTSSIELELLSSDLFQVPRSGLTHSPADFLWSPAAWRQFAAFGRLLLRANPRVTVRVRTLSSKDWIRSSVALANSGTSVLRNGLKILRRHWE